MTKNILVMNSVLLLSIPNSIADDSSRLKAEFNSMLIQSQPNDVISRNSFNSNKKDHFKNRITKCLQDDANVNDFILSTLENLKEILLNNGSTNLESIFTKTISSNGFFGEKYSSKNKFNGFDLYRLDNKESRKYSISDLNKLQEKWKSSFTEIVSVDVVLDQYSIKHSNRKAKDLSPKVFSGRINLDIRGFKKEKRVHLQEYVELEVSEVSKNWKISKWHNLEGVKLVSNRKPGFIRNQLNILSQYNLPVYLREEAIRRGGYAVSSADFNNDGNADLIIGSKGKTVAFVGDGKGGYSKFKAGFESEELVKAAIVFDYNNDGIQDVAITRFVQDNKDTDVVFYTGTPLGVLKKILVC